MLTEITPGVEWRELQALGPCRTTEALEPATPRRHYNDRKVLSVIHHPSVLHKSVDDLYSTMKTKEAPHQKLVTAALTIHRANFGLLVYKHPRPGIVHIYNKLFGDRPLAVTEGPEIGILYSLAERI